VNNQKEKQGPIGVFDSGYGGLTILKEIVKKMPEYDYVYLGDNARAPYGNKSFETVYQYTLECVQKLFSMGCHLVILACNTASAKALRTIQQKDLPKIAPDKRVLGVIRPTTEIAGKLSKTGHVGVLGTYGTITSNSYPIEINKFFPDVKVYQEACPNWVQLVENNKVESEEADFLVQQNLNHLLTKSDKIDTIILGCTHYPLLVSTIKKHLKQKINLLTQGEVVSERLADYLKRHPEIEQKCSKEKSIEFYTTGAPEIFNKAASIFFHQHVESKYMMI
jgi:glutamate racemase